MSVAVPQSPPPTLTHMTDAPSPAVPLQVGGLIGGRYRIEAHIASGGMGRVFRARDEVLQRRVAIKVLREQPDAKRRQDFRQRFVREANIAAQLMHPHCVTLFDYGFGADGACFMAMELLRGQTLAALLRRSGKLPAERALRIAQQLASALGAVHAMGAMHRDLKPSNIFMLEQGDVAGPSGSQDFVKVLDFGLTKQVDSKSEALTGLGQTLGSPSYMAPEQVRGSELDVRVDVYALGAVLFELLVGRPPFSRSTPVATMMAHLDEPTPTLGPTPPADCPEAAWHLLDALLQRALAKDAEARFSSMQAFAEGLSQVQLHVSYGLGELLQPPEAQAPQRDDGVWRIVGARGVLGWERGNASDEGQQEGPQAQAQSTWIQELRQLAGKVGEPCGRPRAARRPRALEATVLGEAQWRPHAAPQRLGGRKTMQARAFSYRRMASDVLCATLLAWLSVLHGMPAVRVPPMARLHITSLPSGAQVLFEGQQVCRHTPCRILVPQRHAGQSVSLHVVRSGCEEHVVIKRVGRYPQRLRVRLRCPNGSMPTPPR